MRLHIVARGKLARAAPEAALIDRYVTRIGWPFHITELPDRGGTPPAPVTPMRVVALDETGEACRSADLAAWLSAWRDEGVREARFLIGAADGLEPATRDAADRRIAFGRATWPHLLVRTMLVEQLYRATTIIAGHPYHREG